MYEPFYKLNRTPFQLGPDPMFFFDSDAHRQGLINLRWSIQQADSLVAITGEPGSGKTELLYKFQDEINTLTIEISKITLSKLKANNIIEFIASDFGVVNMGHVGNSLLSNLEYQLANQAKEDKRFLVLIDNAHTLSNFSLKQIARLCALRIGGKAIIQFFLFGEAILANRLDQLQAKHLLTINNHFSLFPLQEFEIQPYIEHRLLLSGWQGKPNYSKKAYQLIYKMTAGVPWHINLLCHRTLMQACLEERYTIDEDLVSMFNSKAQNTALENRHLSFEPYSNVVGLPYVASSNDFYRTMVTRDMQVNTSDLNPVPILSNTVNPAGESSGTHTAISESKVHQVLNEIYNVSNFTNDQQQYSSPMLNEAAFAHDPINCNTKLHARNISADKANSPDFRANGNEYEQSTNMSFTRPTNNRVYSTIKIATKASIVTSLLITFFMWLAGDYKITFHTKFSDKENILASMPKRANNPFLSSAKSPYGNPNDIARIPQKSEQNN